MNLFRWEALQGRLAEDRKAVWEPIYSLQETGECYYKGRREVMEQFAW